MFGEIFKITLFMEVQPILVKQQLENFTISFPHYCAIWSSFHCSLIASQIIWFYSVYAISGGGNCLLFIHVTSKYLASFYIPIQRLSIDCLVWNRSIFNIQFLCHLRYIIFYTIKSKYSSFEVKIVFLENLKESSKEV